MKNIIILLTGMLTVSISQAAFNEAAFHKAFREYSDRGTMLLPLSNEKIVITKVFDAGAYKNGLSLHRVYYTLHIGQAEYFGAVQVAVNKKGEIDPFKGMFTVSATMITSKGKDVRFPFGLNETEYAQLSQMAFDRARQAYVKFYGVDAIGTFYLETSSWNEIDREFDIEVAARGIKGDLPFPPMTAVYVELDADNSKVLKVTKRNY